MKAHYIVAILALIILGACAPKTITPPPPLTPPVQAAATCSDAVKNQVETDVDCGGSCSPCATGKVCANDADCSSKSCNDQHLCETTSCSDGQWNGGETATDCGGPCPACPTCTDGVKNQDEKGIDCGGSCATACPAVGYALTPEVEAALKAKLKLNVKADFLTNANAAALSVGDSYVYAFGITNTFQEKKNFTTAIEFYEAKDASNNKISGVDSATVLTWFNANSNRDYYPLAMYEQAFLPLGVTVGPEMAPGVATKPGTYYFKLIVKYPLAKVTTSDYATLTFSFKVK